MARRDESQNPTHPENLDEWVTYRFRVGPQIFEGTFIELTCARRGRPLVVIMEYENGGRLSHAWKDTKDWERVKDSTFK